MRPFDSAASGRANAAWLATNVIADNLASCTTRIGQGGRHRHPRRRYFSVPDLDLTDRQVHIENKVRGASTAGITSGSKRSVDSATSRVRQAVASWRWSGRRRLAQQVDCSLPSGSFRAQAADVLVASANCQHWPDTRFLAHALKELRADVLGLQEVDRFAWRTRFAQQAAAVARASGCGHAWAWVRGERIGPFGILGHQGVGLIVRGGIADRERLELPRLPPPVGERVSLLTGRTKRVALLARALPDAGPGVTVAVVHLAVSRPEAEAQLATVVAALLDRPGPHLLLGDLNLPLAEAGLAPLVAAPTRPTYPRSAPRQMIDVVAAAGLMVSPAEVVDLGCSDHLALFARLVSDEGPGPVA